MSTTWSVLGPDPGSAETRMSGFISTSQTAEETLRYLVQEESMHVTEEVAGVSPDTLGQAVLIEVVSKAPGYMHGAQAQGHQPNSLEQI